MSKSTKQPKKTETEAPGACGSTCLASITSLLEETLKQTSRAAWNGPLNEWMAGEALFAEVRCCNQSHSITYRHFPDLSLPSGPASKDFYVVTSDLQRLTPWLLYDYLIEDWAVCKDFVEGSIEFCWELAWCEIFPKLKLATFFFVAVRLSLPPAAPFSVLNGNRKLTWSLWSSLCLGFVCC